MDWDVEVWRTQEPPRDPKKKTRLKNCALNMSDFTIIFYV